jgi:hypothetical protein
MLGLPDGRLWQDPKADAKKARLANTKMSACQEAQSTTMNRDHKN